MPNVLSTYCKIIASSLLTAAIAFGGILSPATAHADNLALAGSGSPQVDHSATYGTQDCGPSNNQAQLTFYNVQAGETIVLFAGMPLTDTAPLTPTDDQGDTFTQDTLYVAPSTYAREVRSWFAQTSIGSDALTVAIPCPSTGEMQYAGELFTGVKLVSGGTSPIDHITKNYGYGPQASAVSGVATKQADELQVAYTYSYDNGHPTRTFLLSHQQDAGLDAQGYVDQRSIPGAGTVNSSQSMSSNGCLQQSPEACTDYPLGSYPSATFNMTVISTGSGAYTRWVTVLIGFLTS